MGPGTGHINHIFIIIMVEWTNHKLWLVLIFKVPSTRQTLWVYFKIGHFHWLLSERAWHWKSMWHDMDTRQTRIYVCCAQINQESKISSKQLVIDQVYIVSAYWCGSVELISVREITDWLNAELFWATLDCDTLIGVGSVFSWWWWWWRWWCWWCSGLCCQCCGSLVVVLPAKQITIFQQTSPSRQRGGVFA